MFRELCKKVFNRFRKDDFQTALEKWDCLDEEVVHTALSKKTKTDIVNQLAKACSDGVGLEEEDLFDLELIYMQMHSKSKLWTVYELDPIDATKEREVLSREKFRKKLESELSCYFEVKVNLKQYESAFWLRIEIQEEKGNTTTFIIHYPQSNILIVTGLKVAHAEYLVQGFLTLLDCSSAKPLQLKGRCVHSLAQLTINRQSQGAFSKFRLNQVDQNPLLGRKRKRQEDCTEEYDCQIFNEDKEKTTKKRKILENTFGDNEQPILEKVEFKLETPFQGHKYVTGMSKSDVFNCRVKFEGPSVLEGLRNLGEAGYADVPLKSHLSQIQSRARNVFVLRKKRHNTSLNASQNGSVMEQ